MNPMPLQDMIDSTQCLLDAISGACKKMPPLWPLKNFVAVNPFVGLSDHEFSSAVRLLEKTGHDSVLLPSSWFAAAWERKEILESDLKAAIEARGSDWKVDELLSALKRPWTLAGPCLSVADALDAERGTRWNVFTVEEVSKWCAAYYDDGQSLWQMPWRSLPLFRAWKRGAEMDRTPEVSGLSGFRRTIRSLPDDAPLAIQTVLEALEVPSEQWELFLHRQLMSIRGWAGYVQYRVRENTLRGRLDDSLSQLLAIRLAYDFALHRSFGPVRSLASANPSTESEPAAVLWQEALEIAHRRRLIASLSHAPMPASSATSRPDVQAVFCIDVRSEVFRRALEGVAPGVETLGFAGFFGFAMEVIPEDGGTGSARCPVLLVPKHSLCESDPKSQNAGAEKKAIAKAWKIFKSASITSFPFVESFGLGFVVPMLQDSLGLKKSPGQKPPKPLVPTTGCCSSLGIPLEERTALAEGALRNMGLTSNFARLVMICGHGSHTANNPYGSSLDCGACGGHAGDANARVASRVLNDPEVRLALQSKGLILPEDTVFLPALHVTTTDDVVLLDVDNVPETHQKDLADLRKALASAGSIARTERSDNLGLKGLTPERLRASIEARSKDWAEVRPEWGLAGNQALIAAPRTRTRQVALNGRAFLHNYDASQDPGFQILEMILTAPVVVASWINLQYFASASNNALFGSGNKVLHNVVGKIGVLEGNAGDLKVGLPLQSVHTGSELAHTPLRLNVILEAPTDAIDGVLENHPHVADLVNNRWLHVFALGKDSVQQRQPGGGWVSYP